MTSRTEQIRKCRSPADLKRMLALVATSNEQIRNDIDRLAKIKSLHGRKVVRLSLSAPLDDVRDVGFDGKQHQKNFGTPTILGDEWVRPDVGQIGHHADIIQRINDNMSDHSAIRAMYETQFPDSPEKKKVLQALDLMSQGLREQTNKAFAILKNLAVTHMPKPIQRQFQQLTDYVTLILAKKSYSSGEHMVVLCPAEGAKHLQGKLNTFAEDVKAAVEIVKTKSAALNKLRKQLETTEPTKEGLAKYQVAVDDLEDAKKNVMALQGKRKDLAYDDIQFCCYLIFHNLKSSSGFVVADFVFLMSAVVTNQGGVRFYLNALPHMAGPGKYPLGKQIHTAQDMKLRVQTLLKLNDISQELERLPLAINEDDLKRRGFNKVPNVVRNKVVNNKLLVLVSPTATSAQKERVVSDVLAILSATVGAKPGTGKKAVFRYKPTTRDGQLVYEFVLTPTPKPRGEEEEHYVVNVQKLDQMKEILGLTDPQVDTVKKALMLHG